MYPLNTLKNKQVKNVFVLHSRKDNPRGQRQIVIRDWNECSDLTENGTNTLVLVPIFLGHAVDKKTVKGNLFNRGPLIFK